MNCADQVPPLLLSREEKEVLALLVAAAAVGLVLLGLSITYLYWALPRPGQPIDADRLFLALALFTATFFGIVYAIFGRWPGNVWAEASIDLRASPSEVWDAIALRDDYPGWKKIYTGIERLNEPGEVYLLHYAEDSECLTCLLPRDPDRSLWASRVEILETRRPVFYRQAVYPRVVSADRGTYDFLEAEDFALLLQPLSRGGTRVTSRSVAVRPKVWFAFLTLLVRPVSEDLRSLKAHLDRTPDETLFGIAAKRMELARNARRHCSCPETH